MLQHFCEASIRCPSNYIGFRSKIVFAKPGSEIGKTTREAVGLNRQDLKSARTLYLDSLKGMRELAESNLTGNANAMTFLKKAILPSSPYSLMAATYLEDFDFA